MQNLQRSPSNTKPVALDQQDLPAWRRTAPRGMSHLDTEIAQQRTRIRRHSVSLKRFGIGNIRSEKFRPGSFTRQLPRSNSAGGCTLHLIHLMLYLMLFESHVGSSAETRHRPAHSNAWHREESAWSRYQPPLTSQSSEATQWLRWRWSWRTFRKLRKRFFVQKRAVCSSMWRSASSIGATWPLLAPKAQHQRDSRLRRVRCLQRHSRTLGFQMLERNAKRGQPSPGTCKARFGMTPWSRLPSKRSTYGP